MSYWVTLRKFDGQIPEVPVFDEGGTKVVGGERHATLNVTYNYARLFSFRGLDGKRAGDTIADLEKAVADLGTVQDRDYWAATPGNAGYAVNILLGWARLYPDAVWDVN